jgi:hypothetical protein
MPQQPGSLTFRVDQNDSIIELSTELATRPMAGFGHYREGVPRRTVHHPVPAPTPGL